jgi:hypothetical protein
MSLDYGQEASKVEELIRTLRLRVLAEVDENDDYDNAKEEDMRFPVDEYGDAVFKLRDARDALIRFRDALTSRDE